MNITGYRLGVFQRLSYALVPLAFAIGTPISIYFLRPAPAAPVVAPVVVLENGKPARLACDARDGQYKSLAIVVAQDLAQALYGAGANPAAYKAIVKVSAARVEDGSDAAGPFGRITAANLEKITVQDSSFLVNSRDTLASPSKEGRDYYVSLKGRQVMRKAQSQDSRDVELNVVLRFAQDRGQVDENVFHIIRFSERGALAAK